MHRLVAGISLVAVLLCAGSAQVAETKGEAFIDKSLSNWEGLTKYWSYKDGALVGQHDGLKFNTFLCSKKKYSDFEMTFKVRLEGGKGNSGVQVRSKVADMKNYTVAGPQADIGAGYWGSLYGERFGGMMKAASKESQKSVKANDFNDYSIRVKGKKVTIKINGVTTVDEEFPKMPDDGIIAFQIHAGGPMKVTFKDIQFHELKK